MPPAEHPVMRTTGRAAVEEEEEGGISALLLMLRSRSRVGRKKGKAMLRLLSIEKKKRRFCSSLPLKRVSSREPSYSREQRKDSCVTSVGKFVQKKHGTRLGKASATFGNRIRVLFFLFEFCFDFFFLSFFSTSTLDFLFPLICLSFDHLQKLHEQQHVVEIETIF